MYDSLSMVVAHHIRNGEQVACAPETALKLRLDPEVMKLLITSPQKVDQSRKFIFVGGTEIEKSNQWRNYLAKNPTLWRTA